MIIERKYTIKITDSEFTLFADFLDWLDQITTEMDAQDFTEAKELAPIFNDLSNAHTLLDRAFTNITEI